MNSESTYLSIDDKLLVFDLDGTLYELKGGSYEDSPLSYMVQQRKREFFKEELGIEDVEAELSDLKKMFGEDTSLAVEERFEVDRQDYFDFVWDIDPEGIIEPYENIEQVMALDNRKAILTTAPHIWASRVLETLGIAEEFEYVQTGEPDHRKPSKDAYRRLLNELNTSPEEAVMIGDQEDHDVIPANELGLKTIYVGNEDSSADYVLNSVEDLVRKL